MNIFSELKIGDKLGIERYKGEGALKGNSILSTQLIDLQGKKLHISAPTYRGKQFPLQIGQEVNLFLYSKKGVYQFSAKVLEKTVNNITTFIVTPTGDPERIQRRNYYRLPIVINATLKRYIKDETVEIQCVTKDLSGGGMRIICSKELENGENIVVNLYLNVNDVITIYGEVVRVIADIANGNYEIGIKFQEIDEADEDKIFAFIFEKQRLLRKKGLI